MRTKRAPGAEAPGARVMFAHEDRAVPGYRFLVPGKRFGISLPDPWNHLEPGTQNHPLPHLAHPAAMLPFVTERCEPATFRKLTCNRHLRPNSPAVTEPALTKRHMAATFRVSRVIRPLTRSTPNSMLSKGLMENRQWATISDRGGTAFAVTYNRRNGNGLRSIRGQDDEGARRGMPSVSHTTRMLLWGSEARRASERRGAP